MDKNQTFRVCAGTLLHDPVNQEIDYMLTPRKLAEMGDDLALRHLAHNPGCIVYFEKPLPDNLDQMIAEYLQRVEGVSKTPQDTEGENEKITIVTQRKRGRKRKK